MTIHLATWLLWTLAIVGYLFLTSITVMCALTLTMDADGWWVIVVRLIALLAAPVWWAIFLLILLVVVPIMWVVSVVTA